MVIGIEWFRNQGIFDFCRFRKNSTFVPGEMAEWSIAAVLKTVDLQGSGGSNPSLSAYHLSETL